MDLKFGKQYLCMTDFDFDWLSLIELFLAEKLTIL
jgi:hypothetical protein